MKRTLSLILAVVMVALMIPFAAIVTSAADDASEIVLPEGWVMTADSTNYQDERGVVLGANAQAIALTTKVGLNQKRVIAVDMGVLTYVNVMHFSWEANLPENGGNLQQNISGGGTSDIFFCMLGGPTSVVTDGASFCVKGKNGWLMSGNRCTGYYRTTADGTFASAALLRWTVGNMKGNPDNAWGTTMKTLYDGAFGNTKTTMTLYVEIDENNHVTNTYTQTVYYDANGNFVRENVLNFNNDTVTDQACDGYLTIGHSKGNATSAALIKSVNIYAGTATNIGETLHSANFAKKGADPADTVVATELTKGEASYNETAEGIRFTTAIDADDFQTLVDLVDAEKVDSIEVGTLITTKAWADAAEEVSFEALDAIKGEKTAYVAVMATVGDFYAVNTYAGTIGNAKADREYVAVGFVKVTLADGSAIYSYSAATTATLASVQG